MFNIMFKFKFMRNMVPRSSRRQNQSRYHSHNQSRNRSQRGESINRNPNNDKYKEKIHAAELQRIHAAELEIDEDEYTLDDVIRNYEIHMKLNIEKLSSLVNKQNLNANLNAMTPTKYKNYVQDKLINIEKLVLAREYFLNKLKTK